MKFHVHIITILLCLVIQCDLFAGRFFRVNNGLLCAPVLRSGFNAYHNQFNQVSQVVFPTVNYFVGAPIRVESIVQQQLNQDPLYQEFQLFKQWKEYSSHQNQIASQPLPELLPNLRPQTLVEKNCSKCHTGPTPKGEFSIDGQFTAIERDKAARAVILGKMPKSITLSPAEKGDLIKEILLLGVPVE